MTRAAAVIGCTGLVGRHCLSQLAADPQFGPVRAIARHSPAVADPGVDWETVDFDNGLAALDLTATDVLFCALGTTIKTAGSQAAFRRVDLDYVLAAAEAAVRGEVGHMVVVSAVGADARSAVFYNRVKGEMENALERCGLPAVDIVRPSLLLGARDERRAGEALGQALAPLLSPLMAGPLRRYRPIQAARVAADMITLARDPRPGFRVHHLPLT